MRISFCLLILLSTLSFKPVNPCKIGYSPKDVDIATMEYGGKNYTCVTMQRADNRVKAKYFAYKDGNKTVSARFQEWRRDKSIILASSGAYEDYINHSKPEGITIDNGVVVNEKPNSYGALVMVYATGGIMVSNIKEERVAIKGGSKQGYDLDDPIDRQEFIACAKKMEVTTFQTHLLVYKDKIKISDPDCKLHPTYCNSRERRFLVVGKYNGDDVHIIVNTSINDKVTLYQGTRQVYDFLKKYRELDEITFMINLDTGGQDVFDLFDSGGNKRTDIKGQLPIDKAANLLVYYYE